VLSPVVVMAVFSSTAASTSVVMTASATDASTEMSFVVVLFIGVLGGSPAPIGITATSSRRAIGSEPATDTESMSLCDSE